MTEQAQVGVDIGGTFTDIALEVDGARFDVKKLTTHDGPERAVLDGLGEAIATAGIAPGDVGLVIHGTTLATNALIERKGAKTALVTTEGFRDVLEIRSEDRYEQYDLTIDLPRPLVPRRRRYVLRERVDAKGAVRTALDPEDVAALAKRLAEDGIEAIAIGFLHSYANPVHEQAARDILARHLPDASICISSEVAPEMREYDRFSTAAANAYVQPLMARYLERLRDRLGEMGISAPLLLMLSGGGLTTVETAARFPVRLVESGPAGGAAFAADIARAAGLGDILSFDMGGTTAKLCLIDNGQPHKSRDFEVDRVWRFRKGSGLPLRIPVIEMVEIGAGGGSLADVDTLGRITVGPESAGSRPGPACYGLGGTHPAVTDADLVLGRLDPEAFAGSDVRLDTEAAAHALETGIGARLGMEAGAAALSVSEIVEENMSSAARVHAMERGYDLTERVLIAFGGAAPNHALRMADKLGIDRVIIPEGAGVGSAIGFLRAPVSFEVVRSRHVLLASLDTDAILALLAESEAEAREIVAAAAPGLETRVIRAVSMRYVGQGHEIEVALPGTPEPDTLAARLTDAFEAAYRGFYDRLVPDGEIECLTWSVTVEAVRLGALSDVATAPETRPAPAPHGQRRVMDPDTAEMCDCAVYRRADLPPGAVLDGPAIIMEDETSTYLPAAFRLTLGALGLLDCRRKEVSR